MVETPVEANEPQLQPRGLMKLPLELRQKIFELVFQDHVAWIDTIPFPRPALLTLQPRFDRSYNVVLRKRVFALLHTSRALRLESFDVYRPLAVQRWDAVAAESRELRRERDQRSVYAIQMDHVARERHYLNALRAEGAMQMSLALGQAEANSR
jgi:hypothetical protein